MIWLAATRSVRVPECPTTGCQTLVESGPFCDACMWRIADALDALPRHYVELTVSLVPGRSMGDKVSGSRDARPPLRTEALSLAHEIAATVQDMEDVLRKVLGFVPAGRLTMVWRALAENGAILHQGPDRATAERTVEQHVGAHLSWLRMRDADEPLRRDAVNHPDEARRMDLAVTFLAKALPQLLDGPTGEDDGLTILELHGRARVVLGLTSGDVTLPMPCPSLECGQRDTLVRRNGSEYVECARSRGGCGLIERDLRRLVRVLAVDMPDLLLTTSRAADLAGVGRSAVANWKKRGHLAPAACDVRTGHELLRVGDVLARATGQEAS